MSGENKSAAELAAETKAAFDKSLDAVKAIAEEAKGKAEKGEQLAESTKEKADEALTKLNGIKGQMDELEQKLSRGGEEGAGQKSLGEQFVERDEYKALAETPHAGASASMSVKADITTSTTGAGGVGAAIAPSRQAGIQGLPQRRLTVRGLLMPGRTDSQLIEYVQETGFSNNAAPTGEGALKPQSDITLDDVSTRTKVIAHWFRVSKQTLSDVSQIRSVIDNRLLYGLALKEEVQLLFGDGTGENLFGIVPQATSYVNPLAADADATSIDKIRLMMLQAVLAEYPSTGIVMNPADWAWIELLKDSTGRYIIGNPQGSLSPTLWGLPVVATPSMPIDKVLTGAFDMGAQIFDQWDSRIETGFQNDDFTRNKLTVLAEQRLALATYRPEAFVYGDFGRAA